MRRHLLATTFLFLLFSGQLLFGGEARERFEKVYPLSAGGQFRLANTNGAVYLTSWERSEVKIEAEKVVRAHRRDEAEQLLKEIEINIRHGEGHVDVDTRMPRHHGDGFWDWLFGGGGISMEVTYWITVPKQIQATVRSVNGGIRAQDISGRSELETTNGRIEVMNAAGSVNAETTNGSVEVSLIKVAPGESMRFETTNGRIEAEFPENFTAEISAHTTNGRVECDFPLTVEGRFRRTDLEGRIGSATSASGAGRIIFRTTNGSIYIRKR
jgi:DUF4097 and DUF4098 domain-containing protein YvlB